MVDEQLIALVTGGAGGIGRATCRVFSSHGYRVSLTDIDEHAAAQAATELDPVGDRVMALRGDVSITDSVEEMVHKTIERFGGLDVLVNLAGGISPAPSEEVTDESWDHLVSTHLGGAFRCSRAAYPSLVKSSAGSIVNISSIAARAGLSFRASYCAAKAGIEGLTRALAVEWAKDGIRVNAVAPGHIRTAATDNALKTGAVTEEVIAGRTRRIPLGRYGDPDEIASVIFFLSSPAAQYISGEVICVDGATTVSADVS